MKIQLLHNSKINLKLWDHLVQGSPKSSIFCFSWYLEVVDDDWSALVGDNYSWVLPFVSYKKQVALPVTIPYLGVISKENLSVNDFAKILVYWNTQYASIDYRFSKYHFLYFSKQEEFSKHYYYQRDLVRQYKLLSKTFSSKINDQLVLSNTLGFNSVSFRSLFQFTEFLKVNSNFSNETILVIRKIILKASQLKLGKMYAIYNEKNELEAVAFILFFKTKAHIMFSAFVRNTHSEIVNTKLFNTIVEDLSIYNVTLENHSNNISPELLEAFGFSKYYSYKYKHNTKQNLLSLLVQYLKP